MRLVLAGLRPTSITTSRARPERRRELVSPDLRIGALATFALNNEQYPCWKSSRRPTRDCSTWGGDDDRRNWALDSIRSVHRNDFPDSSAWCVGRGGWLSTAAPK